jgi:hypothetical protein
LLLLRYFDTAIRMVGWNDTLAAGPITSISFTNAVDTGPELRRSSVVALDLDGSDVEIPNYVIGTAHGRIVLVTSDTAVSSAKQILATHASDVRALAAHPTQPLLAIAGYVPPHAATVRHRKSRAQWDCTVVTVDDRMGGWCLWCTVRALHARALLARSRHPFITFVFAIAVQELERILLATRQY